jgi:rod shape determining protein RodA
MEWISFKKLLLIDFRALIVLLCLCFISLVVIGSNELQLGAQESFTLTPRVKSQLQWFIIGFGLYLFFAALNYNRLRAWSLLLYLGTIVLLIGLFFTTSSKGVQRWYTLPILAMKFQPSELAKLVIVMTLAWFLELKKHSVHRVSTLLQAAVIAGVPFILIYKQPDLGTALMIFPITLVMFYFGGVKQKVIKWLCAMMIAVLSIVLLFFLEIIPHEEAKPFFTQFIKEYQYERLNPHTHHQNAAKLAMAVGGVSGSGWKESEFSGRGFLPEAQTDSVFPAFVEEFGFIGATLLLLLFYALLAFSIQVALVARDSFGRLLSAGIATYLAIHVIINIGMMTALLPITGVPLILMSYGGSSVMATMMALGILQSIYARRYR